MTDHTYEDGEILGMDSDYVLQWNAETGERYCSYETPEEFGIHNIRLHELARMEFDGWSK